jgi:peptidoglycan/xylan/chitin deacetylase (PgdA/CDA1 family)
MIYTVIFLFFAFMFCAVKFLWLNIFGKSVCKIKNPPLDTVYLSFDDGPNPKITPKVLELLDKYEQKASFFCIAQKAKRYPEIIKQIIKNGHTLASHDLRHHWTDNFRRSKQMTKEIGESIRILEEISQIKIKYYRPLAGLSNPHLFIALKKLNLQCVGWSKSARDGSNRIVGAIKNIPGLANANDGDIILMHDSSPAKNEDLFLQKLEVFLINLKKIGKKSAGI